MVVIDQLPSWSFERQRDQLTGGIARMLREGAYFPRAEYPYAVTFTAPGHATLATGVTPSQSGILANHWYDRSLGRTVEVAVDPDCKDFVLEPRDAKPDGHDPSDPEGTLPDGKAAAADRSDRGARPATWSTASPGTSARYLLVDGLAERLRAAGGASATVGIKSRAVVHLLGRRPDAAVWFDARHLAMTTSTCYGDTLPPWLARFNAEHPAAQHLEHPWAPADLPTLARLTGIEDDTPGESTALGFDRSFPHSLKDGRALKRTPAADVLTVDVAIAVREALALGQHEHPDLLGITFSAHDYAGHLWGPESWERFDVLRSVDRELGRLLQALDEQGLRYTVVLTSDHGATPLVEHSRAQGHAARRVYLEQIEAVAEAAAAKAGGIKDAVLSVDASTLYLSPEVLARPEAEREAIDAAIVEAVAKIDGIAIAGRRDALVGDCDAREGLEALACRSLHPKRSGEIYFGAEPRHVVGEAKYTTGTGHGSPAEHDRIVPLLVMGPGIEPGAREQRVLTPQVAVTVAKELGLELPLSSATAIELR